MTLIMALFFLWLGVVCLHRPRNVQRALTRFYEGNRPGAAAPAWLASPLVLGFTRLVGVLCLINFIMLFYLVVHPTAVPGGVTSPR